MRKIIFILAMLFCPSLFAATLTLNTVPYVCQGGTNPQLCNSNITTDSNGNILSSLNFVPNNIQVFTSSGTWIKPAGVSKVYVKVIGGGGNGGSAGFGSGGGGTDGGGGGGGSGGYSEGIISVTGNVSVTIGSTNSFAGSSTISATTGSNGSTGSGHVNSTDGVGGLGGIGGVGNGGTINLTGNQGGTGGTGGIGEGNGGNGASGLFSYGSGGVGGGGNGSAGTGDPGAVIVYY